MYYDAVFGAVVYEYGVCIFCHGIYLKINIATKHKWLIANGCGAYDDCIFKNRTV